jgi:tripartite-type tricarboxylate transporter receptor subunit TctC
MKHKLYSILATIALSLSAWDFTFAADPINLVVPQAPGGGVDIIARIIAEEMTKQGTPAIILNKPGAERSIGANFVATSVPDGKTLFVGALGDSVLLPLFKYPGLKFDESTLVPVAYLGQQPSVLTATPNFPANNFKEFLQVIKQNPDKYSIGTFSKTSDLHASILFGLAGAKPNFIPYKGDSPMLVDLGGGSLPLGINSFAGSRELAKDKKIKYIAILSKDRRPDFPQVGTVAEYNGWTGGGFWYGMFAPAGTPPVVVRSLNRSFNDAIKNPAVRKKLTDNGYTVTIKSQEEFVKFYQGQVEYYRPLVNDFVSKQEKAK